MGPQKAQHCTETHAYKVSIVKIGLPVQAERDPKYKVRKKGRLTNQNMT